jgi:hypothetical protein
MGGVFDIGVHGFIISIFRLTNSNSKDNQSLEPSFNYSSYSTINTYRIHIRSPLCP